MKFAPMNYHYLRYPLKKFLDKVEQSVFNSIDLYCSAPQFNIFDYSLFSLLELEKEIRRRNLSVMAMTPENCTYPVNFCTEEHVSPVFVIISELLIRLNFLAVTKSRSVPDLDISISHRKRHGSIAGILCSSWGLIVRKRMWN